MDKKNYLIIGGMVIAVAAIGTIFFAGRFTSERHNKSDKYDR